MTVLRRLLLEFGIVGDQAVKQKIKEIQMAAQSSKLTLMGLNNQIKLLNQAKFSGGGLPMIGGMGSVLTSREQTQAQKLSNQMKKDKDRTKKFEENSITIAKEQEKSLKGLLPGIKTAIENQKKALIEKFDDLRLNQVDIEKQFSSVRKIIQGTIDTINKTLTPVKKGYPQLKDVKTGRFLTNEVSEAINSAVSLLRNQLNKLKPSFKGIDDALNKFKIALSTSEKGKITGAFDDIVKALQDGAKRVKTDVPYVAAFKPAEGSMGNLKSKLSGKVFNELNEVDKKFDDLDKEIQELIKKEREKKHSTKPNILTRYRTRKKEMQDIDSEIKRLRSQGKVIQAAISPILSKPGKSPTRVNVPTYDKQTDMFTVLSDLLNERERKQKVKQINDMKNIFEKEIARIEQIKKRGYHFKLSERIKNVEETIQEKIQTGKEKLKSKFAKMVLKLPGFEDPSEFESRRAKRIEEEMLKKPKVQQDIKHYNITFKNSIIDSNQREKDIIDKLNQTLRGL